MMASMLEALQAIRMLGRMRDLAAEGMTVALAVPARILQGDSYVMYLHLEQLFARYERVVKLNPELARRWPMKMPSSR